MFADVPGHPFNDPAEVNRILWTLFSHYSYNKYRQDMEAAVIFIFVDNQQETVKYPWLNTAGAEEFAREAASCYFSPDRPNPIWPTLESMANIMGVQQHYDDIVQFVNTYWQ